jgi:hypothetical protein
LISTPHGEKGGWLLHDVELSIEECRIDAVLFDKDNRLVIIDDKVSGNMNLKYAFDNMYTLEHRWQLMHYAWRAVGKFNCTKDTVTIGINFIILGPEKQRYLYCVDVSQDDIKTWYTNAWKVWKDISEQRNNVYKNITKCKDRYGECMFYDLCHG